jgi:glycosyltransferase involved in cell wall biosynthesis
VARPVVHVLYPGLGGQAIAGLALAKSWREQWPQAIAFHGVEKLHPQVQQTAEQAGLPYAEFLKTPGFSKQSQQAMAWWFEDLQPRAIVVHSPGALWAARQARRRLLDCQIIAVEHHSNALKDAKKWLLSLACFHLADHVVYLSEVYRNEVAAKLGMLFRRNRTSVIPNGLDLRLYAPRDGQARLVGMQGRLVPGKDFPTLIRAIAIANARQPKAPLTLEIAGDGPRRGELALLVSQLNLASHVKFLGMLPAAELRERLAQWSVYAHASDGETMSLAIMEAKAAGKPIVASDVTGVTPWIDENVDGLLVPPRDATALALALLKLVNDAGLLRSFGQAARAYASEHFNIANASEAYERLLQHKNSRNIAAPAAQF